MSFSSFPFFLAFIRSRITKTPFAVIRCSRPLWGPRGQGRRVEVLSVGAPCGQAPGHMDGALWGPPRGSRSTQGPSGLAKMIRLPQVVGPRQGD